MKTDGVVRGTQLFLSWSRADLRIKDALVERLKPNLATLSGVRIDWFEDSHLDLGDDWRSVLRGQLSTADFGVLLLSPSFLASQFITEVELPAFVGSAARAGALPVGLRPVPLDGSRDLHGVEHLQLFIPPGAGRPVFFSELDAAGKDRFALGLASAIRRRILSTS